MNIITGVYAIINTYNGKSYIGSSVDLESRFQRHRRDLRNGRHPNRHLQRAWNKYGAGVFMFKVLAQCHPGKLIDTEQFYIDRYKPEYNISPTAGSVLGLKFKHTPEGIANISRGVRASYTPEQCQKLSRALIGRPATTGFTGRKHTDAARAKMRLAHAKQRYQHTREAKEKIRQARLGTKLVGGTWSR